VDEKDSGIEIEIGIGTEGNFGVEAGVLVVIAVVREERVISRGKRDYKIESGISIGGERSKNEWGWEVHLVWESAST